MGQLCVSSVIAYQHKHPHGWRGQLAQFNDFRATDYWCSKADVNWWLRDWYIYIYPMLLKRNIRVLRLLECFFKSSVMQIDDSPFAA